MVFAFLMQYFVAVCERATIDKRGFEQEINAVNIYTPRDSEHTLTLDIADRAKLNLEKLSRPHCNQMVLSSGLLRWLNNIIDKFINIYNC